MPFVAPKKEEEQTSLSGMGKATGSSELQGPAPSPAPVAPTPPTAPKPPTITVPAASPQTTKGPGPGGTVPAPSTAPAAANGFGDQSSLMPQSAGQAGTGYVNLSRVLGANIGAGQGVLDLGNKKLGAAFSARTGAESDYTKTRDKSVSNSAAGRTVFQSPDLLNTALQTGDMEGLKKGLAGLDVGKFAYNQAADKNMQALKGLGNSQTTGRVLANEAGVTGQYAPKMSALDALIYGGNSDAAGAVGATKQAFGNEVRAGRESSGKINAETDALRKTAADAAARNTQTLRGIATGYKDRAQSAADAANATRNSDIANGIMRDEFGNEIGRTNPNGPAPVWEGNSNNAVAENFYQGGKDVQTIAQLLNDPSLVMQNTGPYKQGYLRQDETNGAMAPDLASGAELHRRMLAEKAEAERMRDIARRGGQANRVPTYNPLLDQPGRKKINEDDQTPY